MSMRMYIQPFHSLQWVWCEMNTFTENHTSYVYLICIQLCLSRNISNALKRFSSIKHIQNSRAFWKFDFCFQDFLGAMSLDHSKAEKNEFHFSEYCSSSDKHWLSHIDHKYSNHSEEAMWWKNNKWARQTDVPTECEYAHGGKM